VPALSATRIAASFAPRRALATTQPACPLVVLACSPTPAGLPSSEVAQRRQFHGRNELSTAEEDPWWAKFAEKFREPMIALLLASAGVSLLTKQYDDAISITLVRGRAGGRLLPGGRLAP